MNKTVFISICLIMFGLFVITSSALAVPFVYTATDTPLRIPPTGTEGTTNSYLDVSGAGTIMDLNVFVDLDHTYMWDLEISLIHGTTSVILFGNHGSGGDDLTDVTFDDEASTPISSGTPPYGPGSFRPDEALSAFDGMDVNGQWNLRIVDSLSFDDGMLYAWRIEGEKENGYIPEPASMALFGIGLLGIIGARIRKK